MPLVVVDVGMMRALDKIARYRTPSLLIGLYQTTLTIDHLTPLGVIEPCIFSGYDGLREITGWTPAVMAGDRAISAADPVTWTYDGGVPTGWIAGYYILDYDGELLWLENRKDGPKAMRHAAKDYTVVPTLTHGTRFGGDP